MRTNSHSLLSLGLAIGVHGVLAALLLWGFRMEIPQPKPVQLELWSTRQVAVSQPTSSPRPAPKARRTPPAPKPVEVEEPVEEADINRRKPETTKTVEKAKEKEPEPKPEKKPEKALEKIEKEKPEPKPEKKPEPKTETKAADKPAPKAARPAPPQPDDEDFEEILAAAGKSGSSTGSSKSGGPDKGALIDEYRAKISRQIQSRVVEPPDLNGNPVAEFRVSVLATMNIADVVLTRPSGNAQWDNAAERAIWMNKQLPPLPQGLSFGPDLRTMRIKLCPKSCP